MESIIFPKFSCHNLRHTFTTRLIEQNVNIKVIQDVLGHHQGAQTTLNIYADVTKELKQRGFEEFNRKMNQIPEDCETEENH